MSKRIARHYAALIALAFSTIAVGETTDPGSTAPATASDTTKSPGQSRVAGKFAAPFATLAGSRENAVALATALRTGSPATLTYTSTGPKGTTITKTITITPPTKPMGWGNVSHSLALAQFALAQQGISSPTGPQLQAALNGGTITTADGKSVTMTGVLQQRADGMGWGKIAQSYGTTMGAVNHGLKATPAPTPVATTTPTKPPIPPAITNGASAANGQNAKGITTAGGNAAAGASSGKGVTTAAGNASAPAHGGKGITTANGASSGSNAGGIVSADSGAQGNGNAYGRGVVTASGSTAAVASTNASNGIVTGAGTASGVVTADPGRGGAAGNGHGKGKGGG
jgi:hypothetical protein